jgi:sulfite reductase (NADPH) flavoprotein alpha-component
MSLYNRHKPFYAALQERFLLGQPGSLKNTYHIVLDLKDSGIRYHTGDALGVLPQNDPALIDHILKSLQASGGEMIQSRHHPDPLPLHTLLTHHCSLSTVTRALILLLEDPQLATLLLPEQRADFKAFAAQYEVWDLIGERAPLNIDLTAFIESLQPLLPRLYSIASHAPTVGNQVHLTVAYLRYTHQNKPRLGTCTHYLCSLAPFHEYNIPIYIQSHKGFTVPEDPNADIIMIGPGTGIAPYRGFMQERLYRQDSGKNWLFFGEWHSATDFYYDSWWHSLVHSGKLRLTTAFSRDQPHKIYVQHRLQEYAKEVYSWISSGAYIFVCGDAKYMAKDVEAALIHIFQQEGKMDLMTANAYLKELRHTKRYLRDVY